MSATGRSMVVTGAAGLIGSEVASYFSHAGWTVHGIDNNGRADFFGPAGDTTWNRRRLQAELRDFHDHELDIRDRVRVAELLEMVRPEAIVHAAAQPSHDLAAMIPYDDFDVNAVGTLNLLEGTRRAVPESVFVHMSTNKVYGDAPNELPLVEHETRWDYARPEDFNGIREDMRIDQSKHSLFGASKLASDVMVQEYARYFGLRACCLRGGCLTGPNHAGVELHGFLSYLLKCNLTGDIYRINGYKGKQVRDNIHSLDVARFIELYIEQPRRGEVYNIGGGRENSCSILEAFELAREVAGQESAWEYEDRNREGDHICYISDLSKARAHYPDWSLTKSLPEIFEDLASSWGERLEAAS
ncbi:MAG TPA: NAD-dependent epimerase/dehydratase family protein [Solirubrobacteraceae bacterium]|nr:NAD-dependent epimerase/dehydratase family protein [Solirubrobacteraceae bacterium]